MTSYSQYGEDIICKDFFANDYEGTILDIGANDGVIFSNSRLFINEYNWKGVLVEPTSDCVRKLNDLYCNNSNVEIIDCAIAQYEGEIDIYLGNIMDRPSCINLVSTLLEDEKRYWEVGRGVNYNVEKVKCITPSILYEKYLQHKNIDIVSIDCEGMDLFILENINIKALNPKIIIFEWNSKQNVLESVHRYLGDNYEMIHHHPVNIILKRK